MRVHHMCTDACGDQKQVGSPVTVVIGGCWSWEQNPSPLQEQQASLTAAQTLQPLTGVFDGVTQGWRLCLLLPVLGVYVPDGDET